MRYLAIALAAVLYAVGWLVGIVAVALEWIWAALAVGWDDAHRLPVTIRARRQARTPVDTSEPVLRPVPAWPAERPSEADAG